MKHKLKIVVEDNTTIGGRFFDYVIQFLTLAFFLAFSIETLQDISVQTRQFLQVFEVLCLVVFSVEYLLRIYVSSHSIRYMFSFFGIVDLLAILLFCLRLASDVRALRTLTVFATFRALKLIRYHKAVRRFHIAVRIVKEEITKQNRSCRLLCDT